LGAAAISPREVAVRRIEALTCPASTHKVLSGPHERRDRVDGRHLSDTLDVTFLTFGQSRQFALTAGGCDLRGGAQIRGAHRDALAIKREHEDFARRHGLGGPREPTSQIVAVEVLGGPAHDLFHLALCHRRTRVRPQDLHDLVEGPFRGLLRRAPTNAEGVPLRRKFQLGVEREQRLVAPSRVPVARAVADRLREWREVRNLLFHHAG
jgi:hypothetical protein